MSRQVTITNIVKNADGSVDISFGKRSIHFGSLVDVQNYANERLTQETMEAIAIMLIIANRPNLTNLAQIIGKTLTVDFSQPANWGTVG